MNARPAIRHPEAERSEAEGVVSETLPVAALPQDNKESATLWYKDAIIYQLHVKAFFDSNNDGIGDFPGLISRLDYLQELGITALWLLPFYPSPLRDDGYDIADYRNINPAYGTLSDFQRFIEEAHKRNLRIITELVINHTSDQHPWFQRARTAPPGSPEREYYVWSDTDTKYAGTRIIFNDTETSNWAWDKSAGAYFWHRFFSHQPDLNYDNPEVLREVLDVMYFWLDMGVDGLRLDAIPYLIEREGTSNENLPETYEIVRKLRAAVEARYKDRILLAEANMWPEDVLPYFGEGDGCHMAFHFPLMPRIYMALAQEDRHPVSDILRQTPDIPDSCQWVTFLRNHDELTLEMVTDRERDYIWNFYATDRRARINFGIRRRLAPLVDNDRRKIELLNGLLMSMPGVPVIYYGDEIGMGDNIYLGDRNGVRTPMQWSPDRNGGFSRADPAQLYLPPIQDPIFGFEAINVEAERRVQNSLLGWMRRLIGVAKSRKVFGRGNLRLLYPANRKILAYIREYEGERLLCVANLSHSPQPCELDLKEFCGARPLELIGHSHFPAIGELPYFLTLPAYSFFWFALEKDSVAEEETPLPELYTLVAPKGWESLQKALPRQLLEEQVLPAYLPRQRWWRAKGKGVPKLRLVRIFPLAADFGLLLLEASLAEEKKLYVMGLGIKWETVSEDPLPLLLRCALARLRSGARVGVLYDASGGEGFVHALLAHMREAPAESDGVHLGFHSFSPCEVPPTAPIRAAGDYSNTSLIIGDKMIVKLIRQPYPGENLEEETGRYLLARHFAHTPPLLASLSVTGLPEGNITIALIHQLIPNQGDGWTMTLDYLGRYIEEIRLLPPDGAQEDGHRHDYYCGQMRILGTCLGDLHRLFAEASEPVTEEDRAKWLRRFAEDAKKAEQLARDDRLATYKGRWENLGARLLPRQPATRKTRIHGDFHLGQTLAAENDFYLIDFEGEPARSMEERRAKSSPLKDVAGMLRSFDYAGAQALLRAEKAFGENLSPLYPAIRRWRKASEAAFVTGYRSAAPEFLRDNWEEARALIRFFTLEKAVYEVIYEAENRPDWLAVPTRGLLEILEGSS